MSKKVIEFIQNLLFAKEAVDVEKDYPFILPFDVFEEEGVLGTADKKFVRVKGEVLQELYKANNKNPDSYVISCVDKLLHKGELSKSEFNELGISAIVKDVRNEDSPRGCLDVIASRLAPLFHVKTAFSTSFPDEKENKIISIDFLQNGQELESFGTTVGRGLNGWKEDISDWMEALDRFLHKNADHKSKQSVMNITKIQKDFIKMYLFKKFII